MISETICAGSSFFSLTVPELTTPHLVIYNLLYNFETLNLYIVDPSRLRILYQMS